MQNPSVNDFLDGRLLCDNSERKEILCSIYSINQLRLLPETDRIPYAVNMIQDGKIDQLVFPDPQSRAAVIGHCILASGLCMAQYRPEFLDYIMHRRYSPFLFKSSLPGSLSIRDRIPSTELWSFYGLKSFFEESDHLYHFLSLWNLEEGVEFIGACDDLFHGKIGFTTSSRLNSIFPRPLMNFVT